jgi:uncharacterized membrane protein
LVAEKNDKLKLLITAFIVLVLAVAFIASISDQTNTVIQKTQVSQESIDNVVSLNRLANNTIGIGDGFSVTAANASLVANNRLGTWKADQTDCELSETFVGNSTGAAGAPAGTFTETTDYRFSTDGRLVILNTPETQASGNTTLVSYSYCGDGYVNSSWGRTLLGTNVGFYALAILIAILALVLIIFNKNKNDED